MHSRKFYVYIVTNLNNTVLYTGVTNNLKERNIEHHKRKETSKSFTSKYHCYNLLFYETFDYINNAIERKRNQGLDKEKKVRIDPCI